jgi:hypothetical protein
MDDDQLAELECHLAAGTDLPTALAALGDDQPPQSGRSIWFQVGLFVGLILFVLWLFL